MSNAMSLIAAGQQNGGSGLHQVDSDSFQIRLSDALDASDKVLIGDISVDAWSLLATDSIELELADGQLVSMLDMDVAVRHGSANVVGSGGKMLAITFMSLQRLTADCLVGAGGASEYIKMKSQDEALDYRRRFGGWVFSTDAGSAFWFGLKYTPSTVISHPAVAGLTGRLI